MTTAARQARYRAKDTKKEVQFRLSPEAVDRLDKLIAKTGAAGRGDVIERLLLATAKDEDPKWLLHESIRLGREYLRITRTAEGTLRDSSGWYYTIRRSR